MRKAAKLILAMLIVLTSQFAFAQKQTITGKITDASTGKPLEGASVRVKSSSGGTTTAAGGSFSIEVPANSTLVVSMIGYADQTYKVGGETSIEIKLQPSITDLTQVTLVGTRTPGRIKTESPVPIDVIKINQVGLPTARMDLTSILNVSAPSYNYNKQSGADGADHIDIGTLRGLGADHTLVLINGKRRHPTAFVGLFGTRGRAGSGVDMNGFPQAAVDRIEILRDGASAQYGSDAIAGVINIILKKDINHITANAGWSGYYDTKNNSRLHNANNDYYAGNAIDGNAFTASLNHGFSLGKNGGFFNYSLDYLTHGKTFRAAKVSKNYATEHDAEPDINLGRRAFGDGSLSTAGFMYNLEAPLSGGDKTTFYSFGGYNYKASDAYAYTRSWFDKPNRFPVNADGSMIYLPSIMRVPKDNSDTFYNPHIQTHIKDISAAFGFKGKTGSDWNWDVSNNTGYNDFHYYGDKTFNASIIGNASKTHFDDGGFNFLQNTTNLDFSKSFSGVGEGLNLGFGAEFRYEKYKIYQGEDASYKGYQTTEIYYPSVDESRVPSVGSQGFPGFSNTDKTNAHRTNVGLYADAEVNITKKWLLDIAVRFENYSDFGFVSTSKIATRYKVADNFNIRGSISSGFRAPSLAQINFSNTISSFVGGELVQSLIAPNTTALAKAAGIPSLKEEKSVNISTGFSWKPVNGLTFTADGYLVKVKDRVVLSGLYSKDDADLPAIFTDAFPDGVSTAQFFANAVNTTNYGLDIVVDYTQKWSNSTLKFLLAANFQHMKIDEINVPSAMKSNERLASIFFSDREQYFLKASAPGSKISLGIDYSIGNFGIKTQFTSFGKIVLLGFGMDGSGVNPMLPSDADENVLVPERFDYNQKITTDFSLSYKFSKNVTWFVGADNIFNVHPDLGVNQKAKTWWVGDNESGGPWDSVQMGFNGRRLFTKVAVNF